MRSTHVVAVVRRVAIRISLALARSWRRCDPGAIATLLAHNRVLPGKEAEFETIARTLFRATHDEETAVRRYEYWRGNEPRSYYTLLSFNSFRSFIVHKTSRHHETASPELRDVVESIRLEWVDPVDGASDLAPTAMEEPAAEANDLTRDYSECFRADVASWWAQLR